MLQAKAGNAKIQNGQPGMFYAADQVSLIHPFKGLVTPFSGDAHVMGNPHVHADPQRMLMVAKALASRLMAIAPLEKTRIEQNLKVFESTMTGKIQAWEQLASALKGRAVITQHASFGYLWHWLGITPMADLEPKPGVPPTPAHLARTLQLGQSQRPMAIVIAQHHDPKPAKWLSGQMGNSPALLILPATVTDVQADAWFRWFDLLINRLVQAAP
jgi:zinc/manganese transport system substrate-binding protein